MPFDFDMDSMSPIESGGGGGAANIESLSVTPTTSAQTITASGSVDGYSPVNVSAVTASIDANIVAGNIKKDVQILGVTGTLEAAGSDPIGIIFKGELDANGVYTPAYMLEYEGDVSFDGIKTIDTSTYEDNEKGTFASYFYHEINSSARQRLKTRLIKGKISFPDLETINDDYYCFYGFCNGQTEITEISFDKLETITGTSGYPFGYFCAGASSLRIVRFPKLSSFRTTSIFQYAFRATPTLDIYFNGLTTATFFAGGMGQFNNMMSNSGTAGIHTIHFPSNLESTIQGLTGYPLFGGTDGYVVLAFDLPATS